MNVRQGGAVMSDCRYDDACLPRELWTWAIGTGALVQNGQRPLPEELSVSCLSPTKKRAIVRPDRLTKYAIWFPTVPRASKDKKTCYRWSAALSLLPHQDHRATMVYKVAGRCNHAFIQRNRLLNRNHKTFLLLLSVARKLRSRRYEKSSRCCTALVDKLDAFSMKCQDSCS